MELPNSECSVLPQAFNLLIERLQYFFDNKYVSCGMKCNKKPFICFLYNPALSDCLPGPYHVDFFNPRRMGVFIYCTPDVRCVEVVPKNVAFPYIHIKAQKGTFDDYFCDKNGAKFDEEIRTRNSNGRAKAQKLIDWIDRAILLPYCCKKTALTYRSWIKDLSIDASVGDLSILSLDIVHRTPRVTKGNERLLLFIGLSEIDSPFEYDFGITPSYLFHVMNLHKIRGNIEPGGYKEAKYRLDKLGDISLKYFNEWQMNQ